MNPIRLLLLSAALLSPFPSLAIGPGVLGDRVVFKKTTKEYFLTVVKTAGAGVYNYAAHGHYLFDDTVPFNVLIMVLGTKGICFFGSDKYVPHVGVIQVKTEFYCAYRDGGSSGGSAGTGNLNQLTPGNLNLLTSIDDLPTVISMEYKD